MTLNDLLTQAYRKDQLAGDKPGAVALLRDTLAEDAELMTAARTELTRLDAVVKARGQGGRNGCHVSAVLCRLLHDAGL